MQEILEANLEDADFSVMQLSRALGMSRVQVHRKLKALAGLSASQYIRGVRMKKAHELLKEEKLTIAEIACQTGFKDPSYFFHPETNVHTFEQFLQAFRRGAPLSLRRPYFTYSFI